MYGSRGGSPSGEKAQSSSILQPPEVGTCLPNKILEEFAMNVTYVVDEMPFLGYS